MVPLLADVTLDSVYKEYAGFANATVHLGDRFDLTLGGRYSHNKQSAFQATDGLPGLFVGPPEVFPAIASSENVFTWSVAPRFELTDNAAIYARVAKGFRPGGPNVLPPTAPVGTPLTFNSDTILSYEAGIKAQTDDNVFGLDLSVFYLDWNDVQLFSVVNGFGVNTNAGGAKSVGGELTATLNPAEGLSLSLNGAYTDSELTTDTDPILVGGLDGDVLPFTPKFTFGVCGDYERPFSDSVTGYSGGTFRHLSSQSTNFSPAGRNVYPAYGVLDLRAGLLFDGYALELFARNLTNSTGLTSGGTPSTDLPPGILNAGVIRPRTIGVSLTAEF
jgi:outer membrane receptor protein involved in Fe transport